MADFANERMQRYGHAVLVGQGCITTAHGHNSPLVKAEWCVHGGEVYVTGVHMCLKERICYVYLPLNLTFHAVCQDVIYAW